MQTVITTAQLRRKLTSNGAENDGITISEPALVKDRLPVSEYAIRMRTHDGKCTSSRRAMDEVAMVLMCLTFSTCTRNVSVVIEEAGC